MKSARESPAAQSGHQDWLPVLELGAREVFELMLGCQLTVAGKAMHGAFEVTSLVGLAGQLCGMLSIRCSYQAAGLMASKMLGADRKHADRERWDALGEVCNMVAGNFKNKIPGLGDGCMLSVPTVIIGHNYSLYSLRNSKACEVRLLFENLPIVICLEIHR